MELNQINMCLGDINNSPQIKQIGIVVKNLDRAVAYMKNYFGLDPLSYAVTPDSKNKTYRGQRENFVCKMAFYRFGYMDVELVLPLHGRSVWQDFLDTRGEGLHHIQLWVKNFETAKRHLETQGIFMVQSGESFRYPGAKFGYFDTMDQLGYYLELFNPEECGYKC